MLCSVQRARNNSDEIEDFEKPENRGCIRAVIYGVSGGRYCKRVHGAHGNRIDETMVAEKYRGEDASTEQRC